VVESGTNAGFGRDAWIRRVVAQIVDSGNYVRLKSGILVDETADTRSLWTHQIPDFRYLIV
jgi:hypothetical protein